MYAVASKYPQSTRKGTAFCHNHSDTVLYETYVVSQEESGCVQRYQHTVRIYLAARYIMSALLNVQLVCRHYSSQIIILWRIFYFAN